jgi:hypothetical protein
MTDDDMTGLGGQLDLIGEGTKVPQANRVELLVVLVEAIDRGVRTLAGLEAELDVNARTVRYYAHLAGWLGFIRAAEKGQSAGDESNTDKWIPTDTGAAFADSESARGRLFSQAIFEKDVVRLANQHKRQALDDGRELDTRTACLRAIERMTELSESTAKRRASSLASLLDAAYRPSRVDWQTGKTLDRPRHPALEFDGESFLSALAVRQLGVAHRTQVGFPKQVERFVDGQAHEMKPAHWGRANWQGQDNSQWFGSVPVNDMTRSIALRGGRDLRHLLVLTVPYVTFACAFLSLRDPLDRPLTSITQDMYGTQMWFHETELARPNDVVEKIALELGLEIADRPPHLADIADTDADPADSDSLITVLVNAGICRRGDTVIEVAPGVRAEWHQGSEDSPSIDERLKPLRDEVQGLLRRWE